MIENGAYIAHQVKKLILGRNGMKELGENK